MPSENHYLRSRHLRLAPTLLLALAAAASPARADPLNPLDFPSLGARTLPAGAYVIDTDSLVFSGPNAITLVGALSGNSIAVFSFDSLIVSAGASITVTGSRPVAILSAGDLQLPGPISLIPGAGGNAQVIPIGVSAGLGGVGGSGGGVGGAGGGAVSDGGTGGGPGGGSFTGGGVSFGGGFGGAGGNQPGPGNGGRTYGDLLKSLVGGSGGGGGGGGSGDAGGGGGGGGGAIELGALGAVVFSPASVSAVGGAGGAGGSNSLGGAGGSGGAIFVHASTIASAAGTFNISGGPGGSPNGAGGGGGRIAIQTFGSPTITSPNTAGGAGSGPAAAGFPGAVLLVHAALTTTALDFGAVPVGSSKTLAMMIQSTGNPETAISGRFPAATAPFSRVGSGIFSAIKSGSFTAAPYTFAPTSPGTFTQTLTFQSDGGPATVVITGHTGAETGSCPADFNQNGHVEVQDLFDYLTAWFAGCP